MEQNNNEHVMRVVPIDPDAAAAAQRQQNVNRRLGSAVVSGDSADDEENIFEEEQALYRIDPSNPSTVDELYDQNLDDEDEAYVYKHMRGGIQESVKVIRRTTHDGNDGEQPELVTTQVYKPRNSDAVLSCPCCFNIVCMDCQRHEKYGNQFRAMFVMGITVDWQTRLVYDPLQQVLKVKPQLPNQVPLDTYHDEDEESSTEYFSVSCSSWYVSLLLLLFGFFVMAILFGILALHSLTRFSLCDDSSTPQVERRLQLWT
jgi:hypothetical protein